MSKFKHFTYDVRLKIEALYKAKHTQKFIAEQIKCSESAISRELKRGMVNQLTDTLIMYKTYSADKAQSDAEMQMTAKGAPLKIGHDFKLMEYIEDKIVNHQFSPAAVIENIQILNLQFDTNISESTIYNYIDSGLFLTLKRKHLLRAGNNSHTKKPPQKRAAYKNVLKLSIDDRSDLINSRVFAGHWEMDTVIGKQKGKNCVLLVLSERKSRFEIIRKIKGKDTKSVVAELDKLQKEYGKRFSTVFKSITVDNGCEFDDYDGMIKNNRTVIYYCHPYSSWERGTNENINAMIRRFIPKGTDINKVTKKQVQIVQDWINNYPRKLLHSTSQIEFTKFLSYLNKSA